MGFWCFSTSGTQSTLVLLSKCGFTILLRHFDMVAMAGDGNDRSTTEMHKQMQSLHCCALAGLCV